MTQQDKTGRARHREGELGLKPPDAERAISALTIAPSDEQLPVKNGEQPPGPCHYAGEIPQPMGAMAPKAGRNACHRL